MRTEMDEELSIDRVYPIDHELFLLQNNLPLLFRTGTGCLCCSWITTFVVRELA